MLFIGMLSTLSSSGTEIQPVNLYCVPRYEVGVFGSSAASPFRTSRSTISFKSSFTNRTFQVCGGVSPYTACTVIFFAAGVNVLGNQRSKYFPSASCFSLKGANSSSVGSATSFPSSTFLVAITVFSSSSTKVIV